jgi:hypothetical protein
VTAQSGLGGSESQKFTSPTGYQVTINENFKITVEKAKIVE